MGLMRLREWLDSENRSAEWLADTLGVTARTVYGWMAGRAPRDREHVRRIAEISRGKVRAEDILLRPDPRPRPGRPRKRDICCV